ITDINIGLSKQKNDQIYEGIYTYIDPKYFYDDHIILDKKSDIFSFGVILWEISSRKRPCNELESLDDVKAYRLKGSRDTPYPGTPEDYIKLYSDCWDDDLTKR